MSGRVDLVTLFINFAKMFSGTSMFGTMIGPFLVSQRKNGIGLLPPLQNPPS